MIVNEVLCKTTLSYKTEDFLHIVIANVKGSCFLYKYDEPASVSP